MDQPCVIGLHLRLQRRKDGSTHVGRGWNILVYGKNLSVNLVGAS